MLIEKKADYKKIEWSNCKSIMTGGFLGMLKEFKKDQVSEKIIKAIDKFIVETPEIAIDIVRKQSVAGVSLAKWCYAILNYAKTFKEVEPKRK